jgi:hypothetical protein
LKDLNFQYGINQIRKQNENHFEKWKTECIVFQGQKEREKEKMMIGTRDFFEIQDSSSYE